MSVADQAAAGGVWSRLFVGNDGIDFPQLKVMTSVLRTTKTRKRSSRRQSGADFRSANIVTVATLSLRQPEMLLMSGRTICVCSEHFSRF